MAVAKKLGWQTGLDKYPRMAPDFDLNPNRTALLVIDMQYSDAHADHGLGLLLRDKYLDAASYYFKRLAELVIPNHIRLIEFFRQNSFRIIYLTIGPMLPDASVFISPKRKTGSE